MMSLWMVIMSVRLLMAAWSSFWVNLYFLEVALCHSSLRVGWVFLHWSLLCQGDFVIGDNW